MGGFYIWKLFNEKLDFYLLFISYDEQDELRLKGCQFWNIPYDDLEDNVKRVVWEENTEDTS